MSVTKIKFAGKMVDVHYDADFNIIDITNDELLELDMFSPACVKIATNAVMNLLVESTRRG